LLLALKIIKKNYLKVWKIKFEINYLKIICILIILSFINQIVVCNFIIILCFVFLALLNYLRNWIFLGRNYLIFYLIKITNRDQFFFYFLLFFFIYFLFIGLYILLNLLLNYFPLTLENILFFLCRKYFKS
jgi:hypothetical protein